MSLLCPKEVAAILNIAPRTAQRLMAEGTIKSGRVGPKLWRTTPANVERYIDGQLDPYRRPLVLRPVTELRAG